MNKNVNDSGKSKIVLFLVTIACAVLIFLSFTVDMESGPISYVTGYVITPIQSGINELGNWITDKSDFLFNSTDVRAENETLQSQVKDLTAQNTELLQDKEELDRLRKLYELDSQYADYPKVAARIVASNSDNWFSTFTINKGSNDGIQKDMNVLADSGLVGIVTSVGPNYATVRSIIDDYSNVSAQVSSTSDHCIIAGNLQLIDEGKISLVKLTDSEDKVTVGDRVVTSDISDRFLPGILIGYISEISVDSNNLTKSGAITPVVDFKHLHEVLVITQLKDVTEAKKDLEAQPETETEMTVETDTAATGGEE